LTKVDDIPDELKGDVIADAFDIAEFSKMKRVEQDKYQMNLKVYRDLVNSFDTATKDGWKLGLEQGEKQKAIEIAKMLLSIGDDMTKISKVTGLTIDEIKNLTKS
jgi:predicted transposase/invertase (TIGR01784 family)